jgi:excisionase family DNA binding protein
MLLFSRNERETNIVAELITLEEVADYLRVTKKTIYRLLEKHQIPSTKVGHQYRFDKIAVDDWLRQNSVGAVAKILIVDDDDSICALFKDALELEGHIVTTTTESVKGLELAKGKDYNLIFLDLMMPGIDGAEFLKQIRVVKPELPVTIITGFPDSTLMMNALENGPFGVMRKPFTSDDILTVVHTYINARK